MHLKELGWVRDDDDYDDTKIDTPNKSLSYLRYRKARQQRYNFPKYIR